MYFYSEHSDFDLNSPETAIDEVCSNDDSGTTITSKQSDGVCLAFSA